MTAVRGSQLLPPADHSRTMCKNLDGYQMFRGEDQIQEERDVWYRKTLVYGDMRDKDQAAQDASDHCTDMEDKLHGLVLSLPPRAVDLVLFYPLTRTFDIPREPLDCTSLFLIHDLPRIITRSDPLLLCSCRLTEPTLHFGARLRAVTSRWERPFVLILHTLYQNDCVAGYSLERRSTPEQCKNIMQPSLVTRMFSLLAQPSHSDGDEDDDELSDS